MNSASTTFATQRVRRGRARTYTPRGTTFRSMARLRHPLGATSPPALAQVPGVGLATNFRRTTRGATNARPLYPALPAELRQLPKYLPAGLEPATWALKVRSMAKLRHPACLEVFKESRIRGDKRRAYSAAAEAAAKGLETSGLRRLPRSNAYLRHPKRGKLTVWNGPPEHVGPGGKPFRPAAAIKGSAVCLSCAS